MAELAGLTVWYPSEIVNFTRIVISGLGRKSGVGYPDSMTLHMVMLSVMRREDGLWEKRGGAQPRPPLRFGSFDRFWKALFSRPYRADLKTKG